MPTLLTALFLIGLGAWIWLHTATFPQLADGHPGPGLFPRLIAAGLLVSGVGLAVQALWTAEQRAKLDAAAVRPDPGGVGRLLLGLGLIAAYPPMQATIGFVPTVALLSFMVAYVLRTRLLVAAATAVLSAVVIFALFTYVLGVPL